MNKLYKYIGLILFIFAWAIIIYGGFIDAFFVPGPIEVFLKIFEFFINGEINLDIFMTVYRIAIAFIIAVCIAIPVGLVLGAYPKLFSSSEFLIDFLRSIPASAIFPLFLLIFGVDDLSKITAVAFFICLMVLFNTVQGVIKSKKARIEAARLMGASDWQIFQKILFWESLPQIIIGLRTAVSFGLALIILTEMFIGTNYGIGRRIIDFQYTYEIVSLYAAIFIAGIIGYLLNRIFVTLEHKIIHWIEY